MGRIRGRSIGVRSFREIYRLRDGYAFRSEIARAHFMLSISVVILRYRVPECCSVRVSGLNMAGGDAGRRRRE